MYVVLQDLNTAPLSCTRFTVLFQVIRRNQNEEKKNITTFGAVYMFSVNIVYVVIVFTLDRSIHPIDISSTPSVLPDSS